MEGDIGSVPSVPYERMYERTYNLVKIVQELGESKLKAYPKH